MSFCADACLFVERLRFRLDSRHNIHINTKTNLSIPLTKSVDKHARTDALSRSGRANARAQTCHGQSIPFQSLKNRDVPKTRKNPRKTCSGKILFYFIFSSNEEVPVCRHVSRGHKNQLYSLLGCLLLLLLYFTLIDFRDQYQTVLEFENHQ